jgi:biopolymer transport protein ExbD
VALRVEKNAPYNSVAKVLDACREAGIANVTISAAP